MTSEERHTWIYAGVAFIVPGVYFAIMLGQALHTPVGEISFQRPLLVAIGVSIVANMLATPRSGKAAQRDERDREIHRHGEYIGFFVLAFGILPAFALALLEAEHFWIANAMYLAYVLNALTSSGVKIAAYRRGL